MYLSKLTETYYVWAFSTPYSSDQDSNWLIKVEVGKLKLTTELNKSFKKLENGNLLYGQSQSMDCVQQLNIR